MAENTENVQDLDQDGVTEVTQPTSQGEPAGGENQTPETPEDGADKNIDDMSADELEAKIQSGSAARRSEQDQEALKEPKTTPTPPNNTALEQPENNDQLSGRAQDRFQALARESKAKDEQIASLQKQLDSLQKGNLARDIGITTPPWERDPVANKPEISMPQVKPGDEITPEDYQRHVNQQAEAIAERQIQAAKIQMEQAVWRQEQARQIDQTMAKIRETYPELDPQSNTYDQNLDEFLGSVIGKMGQIDAKTLAAQVDNLMSYRNSAISQGQAQGSQKLAVQAAQRALIPNAASQTTPPNIDKMTADELEALLAGH